MDGLPGAAVLRVGAENQRLRPNSISSNGEGLTRTGFQTEMSRSCSSAAVESVLSCHDRTFLCPSQHVERSASEVPETNKPAPYKSMTTVVLVPGISCLELSAGSGRGRGVGVDGASDKCAAGWYVLDEEVVHNSPQWLTRQYLLSARVTKPIGFRIVSQAQGAFHDRLCRWGSSSGKRTTAGCSFPWRAEDTESVAPGSWMPIAFGAPSTLVIYWPASVVCKTLFQEHRKSEPASCLIFWQDGFAYRSGWQKCSPIDPPGHIGDCHS